mmetsp:Transcript_70512/g.199035  ORF Transcript_70512/g.199035 Transcript_70512/m.199035 type:complete len:226 (+) Transcript_70512:589-1266(+)
MQAAVVHLDLRPAGQLAAAVGHGLEAEGLVVQLPREEGHRRDVERPVRGLQHVDGDRGQHLLQGALDEPGQLYCRLRVRRVPEVAAACLEEPHLRDLAALPDELRLRRERLDGFLRRRRPHGLLQPRLGRLPRPLRPLVVHAVAALPAESRRVGDPVSLRVLVGVLRPALPDPAADVLNVPRLEVVTVRGLEQVPVEGREVALVPGALQGGPGRVLPLLLDPRLP